MAKANYLETSKSFELSSEFWLEIIRHHLQRPQELPKKLDDQHPTPLSQSIQSWKETQKIPPVILLAGQPGIGKKRLIQTITQWIFCEHQGYPSERLQEPIQNKLLPCLSCSSCERIQSGNDVNFTIIGPESSEDSTPSDVQGNAQTNTKSNTKPGTLKIESFRKLKSTQHLSQNHGYRIIAIHDCDRMTPQAANSILKLLEEPPQRWIFFLSCTDPALLLPTLVSRCQVFRLSPFSTSEIVKLLTLAQVAPDRIELCAKQSQGSVKRALSFAKDDIWKQQTLITDFLKNPARHLSPLMDWVSEDSSHFEILLDLLEQNLVDFIKNSLHSPQHSMDRLNFWITQSERIAQIRQESLAPVNRKLLLQDLLFPYLPTGVSLA